MSYKNGKLPFTGSIIADVLIGTIVAYALAAVVLTLFGRPLARHSPGILTYFSFQDGPLGWNYTFYDGVVGPFRIGQDETETREAMIKCGCFIVYPRNFETPSIRASEVNSKMIDEFLSGGSLHASKIEAGSFVVYDLSFNGKKLSKVEAHSYLLDD
jgi:hypothetical protein